MARIAGVNVPENKHIEISLTHIFGIGRKTAQNICVDLKIDYTRKISDLSEEEIEAMKSKAETKLWDDKTKAHFEKEIGKLQRMNPQVAEYSIQRNYLDLYLDLPWNHFSVDNLDLKRAQKILDRDHFGLEEVKKTHY